MKDILHYWVEVTGKVNQQQLLSMMTIFCVREVVTYLNN